MKNKDYKRDIIKRASVCHAAMAALHCAQMPAIPKEQNILPRRATRECA